ncbi:MAG: flagellar protein FlgN [Betaproteobacteria bacterium]|nr:flagellar protein FlgN [Betaproteobacteria bacterium]
MTGLHATASPQDLVVALQREHEAVRGFVAVLQRERGALDGDDIDTVATLADEKTRAFFELARHSTRREQLLSRLGAPRDAEALVRWFEGGPAALAQAWNQLLDAASEARQINEDNGTLVTTRLQHTHQALAILMGSGEPAATYGPDGQARTAPGARARVMA